MCSNVNLNNLAFAEAYMYDLPPISLNGMEKFCDRMTVTNASIPYVQLAAVAWLGGPLIARKKKTIKCSIFMDFRYVHLVLQSQW